MVVIARLEIAIGFEPDASRALQSQACFDFPSAPVFDFDPDSDGLAAAIVRQFRRWKTELIFVP
ncbi:hypothetical protein EST62_04260 [Chlorobaculum sp. 24CR]|uniref:hypothetical protein n=1 Tax=Chlorobaculum sp. 24CR TaxID=2508878 RepID=UPI00100A8D3A|nr:hypothetical protein [Chlorobaculum sp. 24CR]RXK88092.1 hypothetical protein EST62_04260 [Chlorobaculum sp. 24CR]